MQLLDQLHRCNIDPIKITQRSHTIIIFIVIVSRIKMYQLPDLKACALISLHEPPSKRYSNRIFVTHLLN